MGMWDTVPLVSWLFLLLSRLRSYVRIHHGNASPEEVLGKILILL
jgi:hypothetical protein